jgi:hypothetical protein
MKGQEKTGVMEGQEKTRGDGRASVANRWNCVYEGGKAEGFQAVPWT